MAVYRSKLLSWGVPAPSCRAHTNFGRWYVLPLPSLLGNKLTLAVLGLSSQARGEIESGDLRDRIQQGQRPL